MLQKIRKVIVQIKIGHWVKISVIIQGIIVIVIGLFTIFQYNLNKEVKKRDLLEKSFRIKQEAAAVLFKDDPKKLNEAKLRNIFEWTQEEIK